jgi:hypothetical protein
MRFFYALLAPLFFAILVACGAATPPPSSEPGVPATVTSAATAEAQPIAPGPANAPAAPIAVAVPTPSAPPTPPVVTLAPGEVRLTVEGRAVIVVVTPANEWTPVDVLKNKALAAPPNRGFRPNLNVVEDVRDVTSMDEYMRLTYAELKKARYKTDVAEDFATDNAGTWKRFTGTATLQGKSLVQRFYINRAKGAFLVFTCSRIAQNPTSIDAVCDQMVKSVRIIE